MSFSYKKDMTVSKKSLKATKVFEDSEIKALENFGIIPFFSSSVMERKKMARTNFLLPYERGKGKGVEMKNGFFYELNKNDIDRILI